MILNSCGFGLLSSYTINKYNVYINDNKHEHTTGATANNANMINTKL